MNLGPKGRRRGACERRRGEDRYRAMLVAGCSPQNGFSCASHVRPSIPSLLFLRLMHNNPATDTENIFYDTFYPAMQPGALDGTEGGGRVQYCNRHIYECSC
jgi:hypothetical protein